MELPQITKYKLVKRKTTEYGVVQSEIVEYFNHPKASYSIIGMWIKKIGVKDVGELFRQVQKFDSKYSKELKLNWMLKQFRESKKTLVWHN